MHHLAGDLRQDVGNNRDNALAAERYHRYCQGILTGIYGKSVTAEAEDIGNLGEIALLDSDNVVKLGQSLKKSRADVYVGPGRNIVKNDRAAYSCSDLLIVLIETFLCALVVIRGNEEQCICTKLFSLLGEGYAIVCIVRTSSGNDGNSSCNLLDGILDRFNMFFSIHCCSVTGGTADNDRIDLILDLELDHLTELFKVDSAVFKKRSDDSYCSTFKNRI